MQRCVEEANGDWMFDRKRMLLPFFPLLLFSLLFSGCTTQVPSAVMVQNIIDVNGLFGDLNVIGWDDLNLVLPWADENVADNITVSSEGNIAAEAIKSGNLDILRMPIGGNWNLSSDLVIGDVLTVASAGNVGIGTTSPTAKLDVRGNLNVDSGTLVVDSTNNRVGIGTTSPEVKLQVSGGNIGLDNSQYLKWKKTDNTWANVISVTSGDYLLLQSPRTTNSTYGMVFKTKDASGNNKDILALGSGSDTRAVTLFGVPSDASNPLRDSPYLDFYGEYYDTSAHGYKARIYHDITSTSPTSKLVFQVPLGSTRMVIDNSGNVGIGTTSPKFKLHVLGTTFPVMTVERETTATNLPRASMGVLTRSTGDMVDGFASGFTLQIQDNASAIEAVAGVYGVREGADDTGGVGLYTYTSGTGTEKVRITHDGKVGIGTTSPQNKLNVIGDINATGKVISDYLVLGNNTATGLTTGDINASTIYYDALVAKSPIVLCDSETGWCRVDVPEEQKTYYVMVDKSWNIIDAVGNPPQKVFDKIARLKQRKAELEEKARIAKLKKECEAKGPHYVFNPETQTCDLNVIAQCEAVEWQYWDYTTNTCEVNPYLECLHNPKYATYDWDWKTMTCKPNPMKECLAQQDMDWNAESQQCYFSEEKQKARLLAEKKEQCLADKSKIWNEKEMLCISVKELEKGW